MFHFYEIYRFLVIITIGNDFWVLFDSKVCKTLKTLKTNKLFQIVFKIDTQIFNSEI